MSSIGIRKEKQAEKNREERPQNLSVPGAFFGDKGGKKLPESR